MPTKQPNFDEIIEQFTNALEAIRDSQDHLHTRIEVIQSQNATFRAQADELFGMSRTSSTAFAEIVRDIQHLADTIKSLDRVVTSGDLPLKDRVILLENKLDNLREHLLQLESDSKQEHRDDQNRSREMTLFRSQNKMNLLVGVGGWAIAIVQAVIEIFFKPK